MSDSEGPRNSVTPDDWLLPLGLLMLPCLLALALTAHILGWGGSSLTRAFSPMASSPASATLAGAQPLRCALELMDGRQRVERRFLVPPGRVAIRGWLVDTRNWTRPHPAWLRLDDSAGPAVFDFDIGAGTSRGDVASYFKQPGVAIAGFETIIDLGRVPPGVYDISVLLNPGGEQCIQGGSVEVRR